MKKTIVYRKKDGKIISVCDKSIGIDENLLSQTELNLTANELNNLTTNGKYLHYLDNEIKEVIPADVQKEIEKKLEKDKIFEEIDKATNIKDLKIQLSKLKELI